MYLPGFFFGPCLSEQPDEARGARLHPRRSRRSATSLARRWLRAVWLQFCDALFGLPAGMA